MMSATKTAEDTSAMEKLEDHQQCDESINFKNLEQLTNNISTVSNRDD
jgi:hypothetical protein